MGMFDNLRCRYPLPVDGANDRLYQTKDTPSQYLDVYEIREDGALWYHASHGAAEDGACFANNPDCTEWRREKFLGEIRFYDYDRDGRRLEFSAYFVDGMLKELHLLRDTTRP